MSYPGAELAFNAHYARDAAARSWRWSCHRATIPPHCGTGPEAYLQVRRKVSLTCLSRAYRGEPAQGTPEDARPPAVQNWAAPGAAPCLSSLIAAGSGSHEKIVLPHGSRSHSVPPHRAYSSGRRTAMSEVAAGGACIVRARVNRSFPRIGLSRGRHKSKDSFCHPGSALLLWYNETLPYDETLPWPK
jgi:hypothetical protein